MSSKSLQMTCLYFCILFNVLSFGFILGKSEGYILRWNFWAEYNHGSIVTPQDIATSTRQLMSISDCIGNIGLIHLAWSVWTQHEFVASKGTDRRWQRRIRDRDILPFKIWSPCILGELCSVSTTRKLCLRWPFAMEELKSACCRGLSCWTPCGPMNRPLREIYHHEDISFNARGFWWYHFSCPGSWSDFSGVMEVSMHSSWSTFSTGTFRRCCENDILAADFFGPFSYDGLFRRLWMTWRRNTAESFILPANF